MPEAADNIPLPTVPGYDVHALLGSGGMARVYRATQKNLNRTVALKLLRPEVATRPRSVQRFLAEGQMAAQVTHPNVIMVYDLGTAGETPFIAMELIEGGDVMTLMARHGGKLPVPRALELLRDVCHGLAAIHKRGMLHRDLKPHNLLLDQNGNGKIADLGLAFVAQEGDTISMANATIGTPAFMSPEQAGGTTDLEACSDIYAAGATLYAMVCGQPPFDGDKPWEVLAKVMKQFPPDPRSFGPLPEPVAMLIERAMAKDPTQRYQTAQELLGAVEMALATCQVKPAQAAPPPPVQAAPPPAVIHDEPMEITGKVTEAPGGLAAGKSRNIQIEDLIPKQQDTFDAGEGHSGIFRAAAGAGVSDPTTAVEIRQQRNQTGKIARLTQPVPAEPHNKFRNVLAQGAVFGDYRIQNPVSEMASGILYLAVEVKTQKPLFLMIVTAQLSSEDGYRAWWDGYIEKYKALKHPHLSPLHANGEEGGRLWASLEWARQITLTQLLADEEEIAEPEALQIIGQLASALSVFENQGILHRMIEPGNVYIDSAGGATLGPPCFDMPGEQSFFQALTATATHLAISHQSPERAVGEQKRMGIHSDLYSLGALLYSMLSGRPLFEHPDTLNLTLKVMGDELPDVHKMIPNLEDKTYEIFDKVLIKDHESRLHSTTDLLLLLNRVSLGLPIKSRLLGILKTREVYPEAAAELVEIIEFLEDDDPDRTNLLKAASLIAIQRPTQRVWEAVRKLGTGGWMERKADIVLDFLATNGVTEPRKTVTVGAGGDHPTIAEALKAVGSYGCIALKPGTHAAGVVIDKPLFIIGEGMAKEVILTGSPAGHVLQIASDGVLLCGLNIQGQAAAQQKCFGLEIRHGRCLITNCYFTSNSLPAVAVHGEQTRPHFLDCRIRDSASTGAFFFDGATGILENCEISRSTLAGLEISRGGAPTVRSCSIQNGKACGILSWKNGAVTVELSTIACNAGAGVEVRDKGSATLQRSRLHSGEHCGVLAHEGGHCEIDHCEVANHKMPGVACKSGGTVLLEKSAVIKGYRTGVVVMAEGSVEMNETRIMGNMGIALEVRAGGHVKAEQCTFEYGKAFGVSAAKDAVGYISNCVFDGADPMAAAKIEKGCKVAIEGMRGKET